MKRSANTYFFPPIVVLLALAPIFLASERPVFWSGWAAYLLSLQIIYLYFPIHGRVPFATLNDTLLKCVWLYICFVVAIIIQIIPIGHVFNGFSFFTIKAYEITSPTLSLTQGDSVLGLMRWLSYGILFFIILQISVRNERRARAFLRMMAIIPAIYALYAILALHQFDDRILFLDKWAYEGFATGTFVNRNSFATFLGLGAVVSLGFLYDQRGSKNDQKDIMLSLHLFLKGRKPLVMVCLIFIMIALVMTGSRLGLAATLVGLAAVLFFHLSFRAYLVLMIGGLFVVGATLILLTPEGGTFSRSLFVDQAFSTRLTLYLNVIDMIAQRPLLGFGMDSFKFAYPLYHTPEVNPFVIWDLTHSTYLANWVEMGLVIGSIPIVLFALIFIMFARHLMIHRKSLEAIAGIAAIILVAVHSLFDFSLEMHAVAFYVTALLAVGCARILRNARQSQQMRER